MIEMLGEILTLEHIIMAFLGVSTGIIFGAIPGMTATMAVAIFLPLTYAYDLMTSLFLLLGLYVGGISGGEYRISREQQVGGGVGRRARGRLLAPRHIDITGARH